MGPWLMSFISHSSFRAQIDDAAKKEDATAPTAAQKEKLSRRLSARVGGLFNKPKKEGES